MVAAPRSLISKLGADREARRRCCCRFRFRCRCRCAVVPFDLRVVRHAPPGQGWPSRAPPAPTAPPAEPRLVQLGVWEQVQPSCPPWTAARRADSTGRPDPPRGGEPLLSMQVHGTPPNRQPFPRSPVLFSSVHHVHLLYSRYLLYYHIIMKKQKCRAIADFSPTPSVNER